jgi:hypothetical protein
MNTNLTESKAHLADLLVAIERCVYFLDGSVNRIDWPITADKLSIHSRDIALFESISTVNERFAKLQDTLGSAMRHAALLASEPTDTVLRVLAFFEKVGVMTSVEEWQTMRALRNLAAHEYQIDYKRIAEHFGSVKELIPQLYRVSAAFSVYCRDTLGVSVSSDEFSDDFKHVTSATRED